MRPDLFESLMTTETNRLPYIHHRRRTLDFRPMIEEITDLDLADLFVGGAETGKGLVRDVLGGELGDDMREGSLFERFKIEFLQG